jgi:uncharacterized DUF497 family protein
MEVIFRLQGTEFEWEAQKARINADKHGVAFKEAAEVFFDPFYETTAHVLARHLLSEDEVAAILHEIQLEAVG